MPPPRSWFASPPTNRTGPLDVSRHGRANPPHSSVDLVGRYGDRMRTVRPDAPPARRRRRERRPAAAGSGASRAGLLRAPLVPQSGAGLVGGLVLLAALACTVGLGPAGWAIGVAYLL